MNDNGKQPHAGGRPPIWTNAAAVQDIINQYFNHEKRPSMSGLARALGISRSSLYNYAEKDEFLDTIKNARQRIEEIYEDMLLYTSSPTGVIFALKNLGWKDRTDLTTDDKPFPTPIYEGKSTESV